MLTVEEALAQVARHIDTKDVTQVEAQLVAAVLVADGLGTVASRLNGIAASLDAISERIELVR